VGVTPVFTQTAIEVGKRGLCQRVGVDHFLGKLAGVQLKKDHRGRKIAGNEKRAMNAAIKIPSR